MARKDRSNSAEASNDGATQDVETGIVTITVKSPKTNRSIEFQRDFGKDLEAATALFGAETVHGIFVAQAVIRAQNAARIVLDNGEKGGQDAVAAGVAYVPGAPRKGGGGGGRKIDLFARMADQLESGELTEDQILEKIRQKRAERAVAAAAPAQE